MALARYYKFLLKFPELHSRCYRRLLYNGVKFKMPSALIILAEGAEEMELVITTDVLRRAGIDVTIAGLTGSDLVTCSRKVVIKPDKSLKDALQQDFDAIILPGGLGGTNKLGESELVGDTLRKYESNKKLIASICAAGTALAIHGVGKGKNITCHPSVADKLKKNADYKFVEDRVAIDEKFITSRAPGTAFEFALKIINDLCGPEKVKEVAPGLLLP